MFTHTEEIALTKDLLIVLGMKTKEDGSLIYSETGGPVLCNNKPIKVKTDPNKPVYISKHDEQLEVVNPGCTKLMELLFATFIRGEQENENIPEVQLYYFDKIPKQTETEGDKNVLVIKYENGTVWQGNAYFNKIISYIEAMFVIDGAFSDRDIRMFDIDYYGEGLRK